MRVHLKGFKNNNSDAIIVIECDCGAKHMLDEAGEFQSEKLFVYRHGVPVKNLRCSPSGIQTLTRIAEGKPLCQERYRITLHAEDGPPTIEIAHLTPRPHEEVLETETINFPPKHVGAGEPINPPPTNPYVNKPYDSLRDISYYK
jgi:hypothetical protein